MKPINHNVCIVDDDPGFIDSLELLLETAGCTVTSYSSGVSFLQSDIRSFHGCVLLDVRMPEKNGLEVLSEVLAINPNLYIVMMSGHGDIPMAVKALRMGAVDFIEKPFRASVVLAAMEKACASLDSADRDDQYIMEAKSHLAQLTPRELEITEKLVAGQSNKIIAFELGISIRTVETHRSRILTKMQIRSLADLVKMHIAATSSRLYPKLDN